MSEGFISRGFRGRRQKSDESGPTPLVETAAESLVALGHKPARIKTERFGPTGEA